jgi:hypothetical protein
MLILYLVSHVNSLICQAALLVLPIYSAVAVKSCLLLMKNVSDPGSKVKKQTQHITFWFISLVTKRDA